MPVSRTALNQVEFESFHQRIMLLLDTGQPLPEGIRRFARHIRNPSFKRTLDRVALGLSAGENLSDALAAEKGRFPPGWVALVRIGEKGGDLGQSLLQGRQGLLQRDD